MMDNFFRGMYYLLKGVQLSFTKGLKRFIVLPIVFNFLLFIGMFFLFYHYLFPYTEYLLQQLPLWLSFLSTVLLIIFLVGFFLLFLSMFTVIFNIVAAPFNGLLAEKAQAILYQSAIPNISFHVMAIRTIKRQGQFLRYFVPRFIAMGLLFFIPIIHPFFPILWFIFNAWMLSMQYQDFVMDNNLIEFEAMKKIMKQNRLLSLGFGSIINIASLIPVINILTMPAAVIGSVILYHEDHIKQKSSDKPKLSWDQ